MIADNFKVIFVRTGSFYPNKHFQYNFYGYSNDVELAKNIYFLTVKIIQYRTKKYLNNYYLKTGAARNRKLTAFFIFKEKLYLWIYYWLRNKIE